VNQLLAAAGNSSSLNDVEPGVLGFLVVAVLAVALVFLLRSMNKQFKKIGPKPEDLDDDETLAADEAPADGEDTAGEDTAGEAGQAPALSPGLAARLGPGGAATRPRRDA
jgi:hypothetical protein